MSGERLTGLELARRIAGKMRSITSAPHHFRRGGFVIGPAETLSIPGEIVMQLSAAESINRRCTEIADQVVPEYRNGSRAYSCCGTVAKRWQAAWDGACIALGGYPEEYRG